MTTLNHSPCLSQLQLDRLSADDVSDLERARLERHVAGCAACARGIAERAAERAEFVPDPRVLARLGAPAAPPLAPRRRVAAVVAAVGAPVLLCAAGVSLWLRARAPEPAATEPAPELTEPTEHVDRRSTLKGGFAARLIVQPAGEPPAIGGSAGTPHRVHPGDRVQVAVSLSERRFVAAYSRDGAGALSRYSPVEAPMVELGPGGDLVLPNSTVLDDVLGHETIAVFACAREQDDAALRRHVIAGDLAGCEVSRIELVKVAP